MYVHTGLHLRGDETIHDAGDESGTGSVYVAIDGPGPEPTLTIYLPHSDDEADLVLSLLQAAIDNAASRVKIRRQKREREVPREEIVGWNGAGAAVEAARG